MNRPPQKILHNGKVFYTIPDAARYLGTSATKIRQLIGAGEIEMDQIKTNGKLLVTAESLVAYKYRLLPLK